MPEEVGISRRRFLSILGGAAGWLTLGRYIPKSMGHPDRRHFDVALTIPRLTPTDRFYRAHFAAVPSSEASKWRLRVDGLVEHPIEIDLGTLLALPACEEVRTLVSMGNPPGGDLVGTAIWRGVEFDVLAEMVRPLPEATHIQIYGADGYDTSVELSRTGLGDTRSRALVAYKMNGKPLPKDLGFPVRILMPGTYGSKWVAWLTRIEFTDRPRRGYWERLGWSNQAEVKTFSKIVSPPDWAEVHGKVAVQGFAFAGDRRITAVELSVNGGPWHPAHLIPGPHTLVWTQWYWHWIPPAPGKYAIAVRATDETGFTQHKLALSQLGGAYPNGSAMVHNITLIAV